MDSTDNICAARTANKHDDFNPEAIQEELRAKYKNTLEGGPSQQIVYDMTGGWAFKIKLISDAGKPEWQETWNESYKDEVGDVEFVGAQLDANKAKHQPPGVFGGSVKHRAVIIKKFQ